MPPSWGFIFRAGGAHAVLGVPPGALADQHVELEALWPRLGRELRERLGDATSSAARFALLQRALLRRLTPGLGDNPAVRFALEQLRAPDITVNAVASQVGLSRRRLIELFTAHVGMTPKRMSRVLRFQRLLVACRADATPHWARLAATCGYCDQSHLINEVRMLADMSPRQLFIARQSVKDHHLAVSTPLTKLESPSAARG
jgi:AraC-like DNA-binding protein